MKIKIFFAWYDFWIGFYYDRFDKILYICPLPMMVISIKRNYAKKIRKYVLMIPKGTSFFTSEIAEKLDVGHFEVDDVLEEMFEENLIGRKEDDEE